MDPKGAHALIPGMWKYGTLCGERNSGDVMKGTIFEMRNLLWITWEAQPNHRIP